MSLETATYINQLVPANPPGTDPLANAADHLRLIKSCLQSTWPNVTGAITATQENLNNGTPVGLIAMWSGGTVPAGWALCNGQTAIRSDGTGTIATPDLRDRFIVGSGLSYTIGNTGGLALQTAVPSHTHGLSDPGHVHGVSDPGHSHGVSDPGHNHGISEGSYPIPSSGGWSLRSVGGNRDIVSQSVGTGISIAGSGTNVSIAGAVTGLSVQASGTVGGVDNRPPYFALAYIMKV